MLGAALSFVRVVPVWAWALAACLAWGGFQRHRATDAVNTLRAFETQAAAEREQALQETITETERRLSAHQEIARAAKAKAEANARAADAARLRADGVQRAAAAYAASAAAGNPGPAGSCKATDAVVDLYAELLGRTAKHAAELAHLADTSRSAGAACEAAYDGLTKGSP